MAGYTETDIYKNFIKKMATKEKEDRSWKAVVCLVKDTQLIHFLKTNYPEVLNEFYEGVVEDDSNTSDS